jgi:hypothetical protein
MRRVSQVLAILAAGLVNGLLVGAACAELAKIVGPGAVKCADFSSQALKKPDSQREYLAWAMGLMSGLILRAPPGVDEGIDLMPASMPPVKQLEFLRAYCEQKPDEDFTDAVLALYRLLRDMRRI